MTLLNDENSSSLRNQEPPNTGYIEKGKKTRHRMEPILKREYMKVLTLNPRYRKNEMSFRYLLSC